MDENGTHEHDHSEEAVEGATGDAGTLHVHGGEGHSGGHDVTAHGDISWVLVACILLLACNCAMLGVLLLMKRLALLVDALAHSVLPGVVAAYMFKVKFLIGGLAAGLISLLLARWMSSGRRVRIEGGMAVVFAGMMALGYWMLTRPSAEGAPDLAHWLFGNPYDLGMVQLPWILALTLLNALVIRSFLWEFAATTLDPEGMTVLGVGPAKSEITLLVLTVITIVVSTSMVGLVLTVALTAGPGLIALLFPSSIERALTVSIGIASLGAGVSLALAWLLHIPLGVVLVLVIMIASLISVQSYKASGRAPVSP